MVTGQKGTGIQPVLTRVIYAETDDLARHCGRDAQSSVVARSARFCDEHGFAAGQRPADRAEHAADPFFA